MEHWENRFTSATGYNIFHQYWAPEKKPAGLFLLVHGMAEHSGRYEEVASCLTARNFVVAAMDLPGHGKSSGRAFHISDYKHYLTAIEEVLLRAKQRYPGLPCYLLGHSMGGLLATTTLLRQQKAFEAAIISGPALASPIEIPPLAMKLLTVVANVIPKIGLFKPDASVLTHDQEKVEAFAEDPLINRGKVSLRCLTEIGKCREQTLERLGEIKLPLLMIHGDEDKLAPVSASEILNEQASSSDKTLIVYEGFFHEVFNEVGRQKVFDDMTAWLAERQFDLQPEEKQLESVAC